MSSLCADLTGLTLPEDDPDRSRMERSFVVSMEPAGCLTDGGLGSVLAVPYLGRLNAAGC